MKATVFHALFEQFFAFLLLPLNSKIQNRGVKTVRKVVGDEAARLLITLQRILQVDTVYLFGQETY